MIRIQSHSQASKQSLRFWLTISGSKGWNQPPLAKWMLKMDGFPSKIKKTGKRRRMDVRVGLWRKLSAEELTLLKCGVGEDSWESLGLQGDPTSPFWRRSALGFLWKEWFWSWNSSTLATWAKNWLSGKDPDAGKDWRQEEKGRTDDEMVGWHHWLNGHEFEQAPRVGEEQGSLACCSPWGHKESDMTEWLNWTDIPKSL